MPGRYIAAGIYSEVVLNTGSTVLYQLAMRIKSIIIIYCFLISADISVLHSNCTGSDSSPTVQIFFHIAHPEVLLHTCYCTLGSDSYLE